MAGKKRKKTVDLTESEWSLNLTNQSTHPMAQNLDFFFDFSSEVFVILDSEKKVQRLNERFAQVLGWEPADFIGEPFNALLADADRARVADLLAEVADNILVADIESQCVTASGRLLDMKWRVSSQANGMLCMAGQPIDRLAASDLFTNVQSNDITQLIAQLEPAVTALDSAEDNKDSFYQAIFEALEDPIILFSDDGIFDLNESAMALLGFTDKREIIGRPLHEFSPVIQSDNSVSHEKVAAQIEALQLEDEVQFEWTILQAEGGSKQLQMSLREMDSSPGLYILGQVIFQENLQLAESLERRVMELGVLADVAGTIATIQDPTTLLDHIVDMTKERFALYHAQIFLLNDYGDSLRLSASAGEEGQRLIQQNYELSVTEQDNIISYVGLNREAKLVTNIREDPHFQPVAILPETRAEMAFPIMVDQKLLGVLDVQCVTVGRFESEESRVYESLATLIGVALQNARNFEESVRSRQELARLSRRYADHKRVGEVTKVGTRDNFAFIGEELLDFSIGENGKSHESLLVERTLRLQEHDLGSLTIIDPQTDADDTDLIVDAVLASLAAHLENLRLTQQTEEALGETELLYHVSARFNAASSLTEVFQAVIESGLGRDMSSAALMMLELDEHGQPEYAVVAAHWQETDMQQDLPLLPVGQRFYLPDLPSSALWIDKKEDVVIVGDAMSDERIDEPTRKLFQQTKMGSLVLLPLNYRGRWIGVFRLTWTDPRIFDSNEQRAYRALTVQMTTAVNNLMLLDESQIRAAQLEKLSQAETDLSLANDEDAILLALVRQLPSRWLRRATLSYLDDSAVELLQQTVSYWTPEGFTVDEYPMLNHEPVSQNGLSQLWLQYPGEVLNIADVETDYRVPPAIKVMAEEEQWSAVTILPLRSANRWQGLITLYWAESFELTDDQYFLFDRLMEPVAAVVASRRAQLEQQQAEAAERVARRETESLYNASRKINEAETLAMVLAATVESAGVTDFSSGVIAVFDEDHVEGEVAINVVANWYSGQGREPDDVGMRQVLYSPTVAEFLMPDDIIFIENMHTDPRVPLQVRSNFFSRQAAQALLLLPLMAGGRKLGAMMLTSEKPHPFSDRERRVFASLAPQIAIAIQNRSLLEAAQNRARRERILREITAQVRSSNDVDTILRIAAEQVGKAFGRTTFVALDETAQSTE